MLYTGLSLLVCCLPLVLLKNIGLPAGVVTAAWEFAPVVLSLGVAFTAFGVGCHVAVNIVIWRQLREESEKDLADLSGRTRFGRVKKKYKLTEFKAWKPVSPRPGGMLAPRSPLKKVSGDSDIWDLFD